jgi:hypothetical protein
VQRREQKSGAQPLCQRESATVGHCSGGFSMTTVSTMLSGAGSVGVSARPTLPNTLLDLGEGGDDRVLAGELALGLLDREAGEGGRHVEDVALVEGRHELAAEAHADGDR